LGVFDLNFLEKEEFGSVFGFQILDVKKFNQAMKKGYRFIGRY